MNRTTRSKSRQEVPTDVKTSSRLQPSFNSRKVLAKSAKHLRTIKRKSSLLNITPTANPSIISASPQANATKSSQVDDGPPHAEEDQDDLSISPAVSSRTRAVIQIEKLRNKEKTLRSSDQAETSEGQRIPDRSVRDVSKQRFIDPQVNAERVHFDSPQLPNTHADSDISDDAGFEKDHRAVDDSTRRNKKPTRKRTAVDSGAYGHRAPKKAHQVEEPSAPVFQHDTELMPKPSQLDNLKMANQQNKRIALKSKKLQSRKAWTDEETERLIQLVEDHGTSWSLLKEEDEGKNVLKDRDQTALKDKARNIKLDFLKAGPELPKNFEKVPLNKMQLEKLRNLGIAYDPSAGLRGDDDTDSE